MRYRELLEDPLAGYELHGDWSDAESHLPKPFDFEGGDEWGQNSFVSKFDRLLVQDPNTQTKLEKLLRKVPVPIYVFLFNHPNGLQMAQDHLDHTLLRRPEEYNDTTHPRTQKDKEVWTLLGEELKKRMDAIHAEDPQAVIFVLTHNEGGELRHPMTPWMIVHRMCHASPPVTGVAFTSRYGRQLYDIRRHYALPEETEIASDDKRAFVPAMTIAKSICTFAAAREDNILQDAELELTCELMVQYLVSGGVKLQHPGEAIRDKDGTTWVYSPPLSPEETEREIEMSLASMKIDLDKRFGAAVADMPGRIFVC